MFTSQNSHKVMCLYLESAGFWRAQPRSRAGVDNLPFGAESDQMLPERACGYSGGNGWRD